MTMSWMRGATIALLLLASGAASAQVDLAPFLRRHEFDQMLLSPTGQHLAATVPLEDSTGLVILTLPQKEVVARFTLGRDTHIARFAWVNPNRVLLTIAERIGSLDQPQVTGELYAVDVDGSRPRMLVGTRMTTGGAATRIGQAEDVFASLVDDLSKDDRKVLIAVSPWARDPYTRLEAMDVYTARRTTIAKAPVRNAGFLVDHQGELRFAGGSDGDNASKLYYRKDAESDWVLVNDESSSRRAEYALAFSADDRTAYLQVEHSEGPDSIVAYDVASGERKTLVRDATFDPAGYIGTLVGESLAGVRFRGAESRNVFFDDEGQDALLHRSLEASFPGQRVSVVSATQDGKLALLLLDGPDNPGDYYLFEIGQSRATYLASKRRWMDPAKMAPTRPVTIKARDGLELRGFLTTPKDHGGKGLPLVVMPHGGPFGIQDLPNFDDDVELLARAGYAVLRVNFRGSGGRGRAFQQAGAQQWGLKMQDDLTDATQWAIREGIADGQRICMYGASYGGYASLMAVAKEPGLYRCAVGYVGVYDLPLLHTNFSAFSGSRRTYTEEWIGQRDALEAVSPTALAGRIKVPVFLAAGLLDTRAPPEHTRRMEKALRTAGASVEAMYAQGEAHGFYTEANRRELYTRLLAFLSTHLGGQAAK